MIAVIGIATSSWAQTKAVKVSHTEPLYFDLVRDLGARKGEKEWNLGSEFSNTPAYNENNFLVEYEFAPVNRLGVEVETDFSFYKHKLPASDIPNHKLDCIRLSAQYSFFVSAKYRTSMAVGYTQVGKLTEFKNYGKSNLLSETSYNPFFVVAKRWGNNIHSLVYVTPEITMSKVNPDINTIWQMNTSVHYVIPQTKHFIGVEFNKEIDHGKFNITIRPQVKIKLSPKLALGIVTGIPINQSAESCSSFFRIIYEP